MGLMGKKNERYCVRAIAGKGWQIWDRKMNKKWGKPNKDFPSDLLEKLNNGRRSEIKY
jgi:hypothetical protein